MGQQLGMILEGLLVEEQFKGKGRDVNGVVGIQVGKNLMNCV
jgi:hypothetical protein